MENDGVESGVGEMVISSSDDDHITSVGVSTLRTSSTAAVRLRTGRGRSWPSSHVITRQGWKKVTAFHALYLAFNAILIEYNNMRYQNLKQTSFGTHPLAMTTSVIAFFIYGSASALQYIFLGNYEQYKKYSRFLNHAIIFSAIITSVANALVFLPNSMSWVVLALFELCTALVLAYDFVWFVYNKINATTSSVPTIEIQQSPEVRIEINEEIDPQQSGGDD